MISIQAARSKAAIAHFIGDGKMWLEAMWEMRCCYIEVEEVEIQYIGGEKSTIKLRNV